ncbi:MAG: hypothetical protein RI924_91 [Bacteroidota bacterium]|jgi:(2Fe-2S) ferredoxin
MLYEKHIFICTNQRPEGSRVCCGEEKGLALTAAFKKAIKDQGLNTTIRAQRAGCFDICEQGPNVIIYPEGTCYGGLALSDVEEIVAEHLQQGRIVERLVINTDNLK